MDDWNKRHADYVGGARPNPRAAAFAAATSTREHLLKKFLVAAIAAASLAAAGPATAPAHQPISASASKTCSSGWTHAVIGGSHKCLRRGQFCARRYDQQYHRYGFHCHRQDARGNYHLT